MFVGHYAASFAAKALRKTIPLWMLFLAVQLLDVCWSILVLAGVEKVRIVPGITATNPLDLYYMPYTHGLDTAILWALLAAVVYRVFRGHPGWGAAGLVGTAVFSHWLLDLLVHRPDLPLYDDRLKVGLGLWNYPAPASVLEIVLLFGCMSLYWTATKPIARGGRTTMVVFALGMFAVQGIVFFGPPPASDRAAALSALGAYLVFAGVVYYLEKTPAHE